MSADQDCHCFFNSLGFYYEPDFYNITAEEIKTAYKKKPASSATLTKIRLIRTGQTGHSKSLIKRKSFYQTPTSASRISTLALLPQSSATYAQNWNPYSTL